MTINEILKARGLDDTAINAVLDDLKANKLYFSSEENLDIRYGKLKDQHAGTSKQREEALASLEKVVDRLYETINHLAKETIISITRRDWISNIFNGE